MLTDNTHAWALKFHNLICFGETERELPSADASKNQWLGWAKVEAGSSIYSLHSSASPGSALGGIWGQELKLDIELRYSIVGQWYTDSEAKCLPQRFRFQLLWK